MQLLRLAAAAPPAVPRPTARNQVEVGNLTYLPKQGGGWLYLANERTPARVRESRPEDLVSEAPSPLPRASLHLN